MAFAAFRPLVLLLALTPVVAQAEALRFLLVARDSIETRLRDYRGTNAERGARLKSLFAEAGCGNLADQPVSWTKIPNVICTLPGETSRTIIVGAHFDRTPGSEGVADNWSGASLLPSLFLSVKSAPRRHTYVFVGFTEEENGLIGSRFYARKMTRDQVAATAAMVNLDTLGLSPTKVWTHRAEPRLTLALLDVATTLGLPLSGVNFEQVGSSDSESFAARKIPRITIHSLTQQTENEQILHSRKDQLSAMSLDDYYASYHLIAAYLVYLDQLGAPGSGSPTTTRD